MDAAIAVDESCPELKISELYEHAKRYVHTENWHALKELKRTLRPEEFARLRSHRGTDGLTLGEIISPIWVEKEKMYADIAEANVTWQGDKKAEHHPLSPANDLANALMVNHHFNPILPPATPAKMPEKRPYPF